MILTREHRDALLAECPALSPYVRILFGGDEFLNGIERWCLWLVDAPPQLLRQSALLRARIDTVRRFREASGREQTRKLAATPALFGEVRQPTTPYILIPKVSSELRPYIPIGFVQPEIIASGSALIVPGATRYDFGILTSAMHNAWMRCVAGRLESRFQYSNNIVYNNFPWPNPTPAQRERVEEKAHAVLAARAEYLADGARPSGRFTVTTSAASDSKTTPSDSGTLKRAEARAPKTATLADLYDPNTMPRDLLRAHTDLDRAVEKCYRAEPFHSDRERVEHLFRLYEQVTAPLLPATPRARARRSQDATTAPRPRRNRTPGLSGQTPST